MTDVQVLGVIILSLGIFMTIWWFVSFKDDVDRVAGEMKSFYNYIFNNPDHTQKDTADVQEDHQV